MGQLLEDGVGVQLAQSTFNTDAVEGGDFAQVDSAVGLVDLSQVGDEVLHQSDVVLELTDGVIDNLVGVLDLPLEPVDLCLLATDLGGTSTRLFQGVLELVDLPLQRSVLSPKPKVVSVTELRGFGSDCVVNYPYAYVTMYYGGLNILDISDPAHPVLIDWVGYGGYQDEAGWDNLGCYQSVATYRGTAHITEYYTGLMTFDVPTPSQAPRGAVQVRLQKATRQQ